MDVRDPAWRWHTPCAGGTRALCRQDVRSVQSGDALCAEETSTLPHVTGTSVLRGHRPVPRGQALCADETRTQCRE